MGRQHQVQTARSCLFAAEGERVSCVMEWSLGTRAARTGGSLFVAQSAPFVPARYVLL
jgi:hypothetical protein